MMTGAASFLLYRPARAFALAALLQGVCLPGAYASEDFIWLEGERPAADAAADAASGAALGPVRDYPVDGAPVAGQPLGGAPRYMDQAGGAHDAQAAEPSVDRSPVARTRQAGGVNPDHRAFAGEQWGLHGPALSSRAGKDVLTPEQMMRGEHPQDDGVIEGIVDRPIPELIRRGGETAGSAAGYTHPDAIRRVNTLEDRRIPPHMVYARVDPETAPLWTQKNGVPSDDLPGEWVITEGQYLSDLLRRWSEAAGWDLVWRTQADFLIESNVSMHATFPEAVGKVVESFRNASPAISADFFFDNKVVVVRSSAEFDSR